MQNRFVYREQSFVSLSFINVIMLIFSVQNNMIMPGEHGQVRITLFKKMVMTTGQQFTIRENGATVATGIITEPLESICLTFNKLSKAEVVD